MEMLGRMLVLSSSEGRGGRRGGGWMESNVWKVGWVDVLHTRREDDILNRRDMRSDDR